MIADQRTRDYVGRLPSGSCYVIEVPDRWNGVLLLLSHPVPVGPHEPPWPPGEPLVHHLLSADYAVAGCANTIFWPAELAFGDHPALLDVARRALGPARHTIVVGQSIGGMLAAGGVQRYPHLLSGALAIGGNLAGAVANHNRELDIAFVVNTLLGAGAGIEVVRIGHASANLAAAAAVLQRAQATPAGRARLALAAAVGNIPGWYDPTAPEPAPGDYEARQRNQFSWFDEVGFLVFFLCRKQVEMQAGGNPSWNVGVNYRAALAASINRDEVEALYRSAGIDLDADLDRLALEPRIDADPGAVSYLERHITFTGDLGETPVVTVHTDGDGLVVPDHEHAYAEVVGAAGQDHLLRQLYVHRGGHGTTTFAEVRAALDVLIERIEGGAWPDCCPDALNAAAGRLGPEANTLGSLGGPPAAPAFFEFTPRPFFRSYDGRRI